MSTTRIIVLLFVLAILLGLTAIIGWFMYKKYISGHVIPKTNMPYNIINKQTGTYLTFEKSDSQMAQLGLPYNEDVQYQLSLAPYNGSASQFWQPIKISDNIFVIQNFSSQSFLSITNGNCQIGMSPAANASKWELINIVGNDQDGVYMISSNTDPSSNVSSIPTGSCVVSLQTSSDISSMWEFKYNSLGD